MNAKMIAVIAVAVLAVAGIGTAIVLTQQPAEKKGLYKLDATVIDDIDMGGMSGTPKMVETLEHMYESVYGELTDTAKAKTLDDAKADKTFWDTYAKFTSIASRDGDNVTYKTVVDDKTTKFVEKNFTGKATKIIGTGSAYPYAAYIMLCQKYSVKPWSSEAKAKTELTNEFQSLIYGGLVKSSVADSSKDLEAMLPSTYVEACKSIGSYETEKMAADVKAAVNGGAETVFLMGSGTLAKTSNATFVTTVENEGGHILLNNAKGIPDTLAMIEQIGIILGFDSSVVDGVIQDFQLRMYKIYVSAQDKNAANPDKTYKAYFEGSSGKASSASSNGAALSKFFGWDTTLFDGAEHDLENLLTEKPNILMFYSNDDRTMDEKMRATS